MKRLIAAMLLMVPVAAWPGVEKIAIVGDSGIRFVWWPKVAPPDGWHFDEGSSHHFAFNAMAPDGSTFSDAETVLYAKAGFKPRLPAIASLESFVQSDIADFRTETPSLVVSREKPLYAKDHKPFQVVSYFPKSPGSGNWEQVAYGEDGDYYITIAISSRTREGLIKSRAVFQALVASYATGP